MTAELVSVASLFVMFGIMCFLIKIHFAMMDMQPRMDQRAVMNMRTRTYPGQRTVMNEEQHQNGNQGAQARRQSYERLRAQQHDERFC